MFERNSASRIEMVSALVQYLEEAATYGNQISTNQSAYEKARLDALDDSFLSPLLPDFVKKYRALGQFRTFAQKQGGYHERRDFLHHEFEPVFRALEKPISVDQIRGSSTQRGLTDERADRQISPSEIDAFISYASEDRDGFVELLANALRNLGLSVWYDRFSLKLGDSLSRKIDEGLRSCRYGILVLSTSFFQKRWPETEYRALVSRAKVEGRSLILPLYHGVTHEDVVSYSPLLGDVYGVPTDQGLNRVVDQIIDVVRPKPSPASAAEPISTITKMQSRSLAAPDPKLTEYEFAPYRLGEPGVPSDAVAWQPVFAGTQPCLEVTFGEPRSVNVGGDAGARWVVNWVVVNIGGGAARAIRIFLPCLTIDRFESLRRDEKHESGVFCDDRSAFWSLIRSAGVQAIIEYEDVLGVLYRQYGAFEQYGVPAQAYFKFGISRLGKPFRVSGRIVGEDLPSSWIVRHSQ